MSSPETACAFPSRSSCMRRLPAYIADYRRHVLSGASFNTGALLFLVTDPFFLIAASLIQDPNDFRVPESFL